MTFYFIELLSNLFPFTKHHCVMTTKAMAQRNNGVPTHAWFAILRVQIRCANNSATLFDVNKNKVMVKQSGCHWFCPSHSRSIHLDVKIILWIPFLDAMQTNMQADFYWEFSKFLFGFPRCQCEFTKCHIRQHEQ